LHATSIRIAKLADRPKNAPLSSSFYIPNGKWLTKSVILGGRIKPTVEVNALEGADNLRQEGV
jgi:hypothetical protein